MSMSVRFQDPVLVVRPLVLPVVVGVAFLVGCSGGSQEPRSFPALATAHLAQIDGEMVIPGLGAEVEVLRDPWGVPHIYAQNLDDLFFAQGFVQAQDRLWQMEMYRARLLKYRGPWTDEEFRSYHPEGRRILEAFTRGVNAYIEQAGDRLPVEFALTGIRPEPWGPETPLLRMQTAMPLGDARSELRLARQVAELGPEEANRRADPTPFRPLTVPQGIDLSLIGEDVASALSGFRNDMPRPELVAPYDSWVMAGASENLGAQENSPGSNNWVIGPSLTASGKVLVANDPHRGVTNPSLRYVVHLDAPGWTAIGSTEPVLPGVAIGHNGRVAWGLTIVGTDQSDVYVETTNPEDPNQVLWNGAWEPLRVVVDTIQVKGSEPELVELKYSRHGPVFFEDPVNHLAYALRSTMHQPGSTGYLAALRLDVVDDCREFLEELDFWKAPTENMICGWGGFPFPDPERTSGTGSGPTSPGSSTRSGGGSPLRTTTFTLPDTIRPSSSSPAPPFPGSSRWPPFSRPEDPSTWRAPSSFSRTPSPPRQPATFPSSVDGRPKIRRWSPPGRRLRSGMPSTAGSRRRRQSTTVCDGTFPRQAWGAR